MQEISCIDYKGKNFSGIWNEKTYSSKIEEKPELKRIYVDNEPVHITEKEYAKLIGGAETLKRQRHFEKMCSLKKEIKTLNLADKLEIILFVLDDEKFISLFDLNEEENDKIRWDFEYRAERLMREEKEKNIYIGDLTRVANKLLARKDLEDEYIAEYEGVKLSSKEIRTINWAYKKVYGMSRNEYIKSMENLT